MVLSSFIVHFKVSFADMFNISAISDGITAFKEVLLLFA